MPPRKDNLQPFWQTNDGKTVRLYQGDVLRVLHQIPPKSVQCVVTSPPYWGLRSYATDDKKYLELGSEARPDCLGWARGENCVERDWAAGCHVCRMVLVFREVRRVLRDDGTMWLNYGDTYNANQNKTGLAPGNLVGVPWRVALALQADGWVLRQDIIWHKPSPMPESVRNRCTKAHEYVFLLTKRMGYFCDMEAIKEESKQPWNSANSTLAAGGEGNVKNRHLRETGQRITAGADTHHPDVEQSKSNKRSVWSVTSQGYPGAHFATYPPKLIEPMILAGTSEYGACVECGSP